MFYVERALEGCHRAGRLPLRRTTRPVSTTVVAFEVVREDRDEDGTPGFTALAAVCAATTALALASRRRRLP